MPTLKEKIIKEFGEEFGSCWVRNIHTDVQKHLEDWISSTLSQYEEAVRECVPDKTPYEARIAQNRNGQDYCSTCEQAWEYCSCSARNTGFNSAIEQMKNNLNNL